MSCSRQQGRVLQLAIKQSMLNKHLDKHKALSSNGCVLAHSEFCQLSYSVIDSPYLQSSNQQNIQILWNFVGALKSTDANRSRSTIAAGAVDEFSGKCCTRLQITQSAEQSQQACTLCFLFHRWEHCQRLAVSSVKQKGLKNPASKESFPSNFVYVTIRPQHRAVHAPKSGMWWIGRGWAGEWKGPARGLHIRL